jgi:hypothetical protein
MPCRAKVPRRKLMSPLGVWYRVGPKDLRWSDSAVYPSPQSHSGHGTARKPGSCWRRARLSLAVGDLKSWVGLWSARRQTGLTVGSGTVQLLLTQPGQRFALHGSCRNVSALLGWQSNRLAQFPQ